jgi:hypothetical protein
MKYQRVFNITLFLVPAIYLAGLFLLPAFSLGVISKNSLVIIRTQQVQNIVYAPLARLYITQDMYFSVLNYWCDRAPHCHVESRGQQRAGVTH